MTKWTLDVGTMSKRAQATLDGGDAKQNESDLSRDVLALVAEVETMREIDASHVRRIDRLKKLVADA